MMDSRRFQGSFEHDFCSYSRQRNWSFQKFACAELNLVSFLLIMVYLKREEFEVDGGAATALKISLLKALETLLPGMSSV